MALPNIAHYSQRVSFLRGRFSYTETGPLDRTHLRFYTFWTAIEFLQKHGFTLVVADRRYVAMVEGSKVAAAVAAALY